MSRVLGSRFQTLRGRELCLSLEKLIMLEGLTNDTDIRHMRPVINPALDFSQGATLPNQGIIISNGRIHDVVIAAVEKVLGEAGG